MLPSAIFPAIGNAVRGKHARSPKAQFAAESIVLNELDCGPAELVAEFHVVAARFPGIVIDEVPVGIDARARNRVGGTDWRETGDRNVWQTKIKGRGHAGVVADGIGVEGVILRKEAFRKTVPAQARFVDLGRTHHLDIGDTTPVVRGSA